MASEKITALVEEVKTLTVLELSELVHELEEVFGVSAAQLNGFGELPSKNALVASVLGTFLAPISSLAFVLDQVRIQKEGGAPAAEEAPAE